MITRCSTRPLARSTTRSMRENARPPNRPRRSDPAHFVRDARVRVTGEDGVDHARRQTCGQLENLGPALARREVARGVEAGTRPPAWAVTTTMVAPADLSRRLSASMTGASGSSRSPCVFAAIVCRKPPLVITPMTPTLTPAASTSMDGRTFGHATGRPVAVSARLAARNGTMPPTPVPSARLARQRSRWLESRRARLARNRTRDCRRRRG